MRNSIPQKALTQLDKTVATYAATFSSESNTMFKMKLARVALAKTPAQSAEALDALLAEIASHLNSTTPTTPSAIKTYTYNAGDAMAWHDKVFTDTSVERCSVCGRKLGANPFYVEVHNGGDLVEFGKGVHDGGYQGCWAIGSECAKKFSPELLGNLNAKAGE